MSSHSSFTEYVMAMDRVERRLRRATAALDDAGIPYAVIGGNAVATWIAKVDPAATRTTKDVDLLIRRSDIDLVTAAMASIGFTREDLRSITLFVDPDEPSRKSGIHIVWAGERVRPSYQHPAPDLDEAVREQNAFSVLSLPALVRMKLTSLRNIDRVHIEDLIRARLIDTAVRATLPPDLLIRLQEIESAMDDVDEEP